MHGGSKVSYAADRSRSTPVDTCKLDIEAKTLLSQQVIWNNVIVIWSCLAINIKYRVTQRMN